MAYFEVGKKKAVKLPTKTYKPSTKRVTRKTYNPDVVEGNFIKQTFIPSPTDSGFNVSKNYNADLRDLGVGGLGSSNIMTYGIIGIAAMAILSLLR